tara:strand:- start:5109 stop:5633 length:525 start_codon:yes stop_codon:yes gene_type:complete
MKKLLILPILFISFAFTDEVYYTIKSFGSKTQKVIENIEILEIKNGRLIYKDKNKKKKISCSSIDFIKLVEKGVEINFQPDCLFPNPIKRIDMLTKEDDILSVDTSKHNYTIDSKKGYIGGYLIALGGGLLYSNYNKSIEDGETFEEYSNRLETTSKIGYFFIIMGGIMVGFGI